MSSSLEPEKLPRRLLPVADLCNDAMSPRPRSRIPGAELKPDGRGFVG
jgi:hypothetical protein